MTYNAFLACRKNKHIQFFAEGPSGVPISMDLFDSSTSKNSLYQINEHFDYFVCVDANTSVSQKEKKDAIRFFQEDPTCFSSLVQSLFGI